MIDIIMITEILSKITSESLLSLYPTIVKNIDIPFDMKLWTRFVPYSLISLLFIDFKFVKENLFSKAGLLLSFITMIHIYTSYKGFEGLESGVAYTIFYTYPVMILLIAGEKITPVMLIPLIGVGLLVYESNTENMESKDKVENLEEKVEEKDEKTTENDNLLMFSVFMVFLAALTEALLYFVVRDLKTNNNWNHLFISYFFGAILLSGSLLTKLKQVSVNGLLTTSFALNILIGLFGYLLRFYATTRLEPSVYAPLSYIGIIMSHIYGLYFNGDIMTWKKMLGTILIIIPNVYMKL
jgi:drug/metabolite transporter (DMT)-like permease